MTDAFDRWLERELPRALVPASPPAHPRFLELRPAGTAYRVRFGRLRTRIGKAAMVGVGVAFVATAGISAKAVLTGSPNPFFGSQRTAPNSPQGTARGAGAGTNVGSCPSSGPKTNSDEGSGGVHPFCSASSVNPASAGGTSGLGPPAHPSHPAHPTAPAHPLPPAHPTPSAHPTSPPHPSHPPSPRNAEDSELPVVDR
jgi:hypothetical protein